MSDRHPCEQVERSADALLQPGNLRALEGLLEKTLIGRAGPDRPERVDRGLAVPHGLRKLERALGPGDCLLRTSIGRAVRGKVGVRDRKLAARWQVFQQRDRLPGAAVGLRNATGTPEELRETAEIVTLLERLAERPPTAERFFERRNSLVVLVGDEARFGAALQQLGPLGKRKPVTEAKRTCVLIDRLSIRAECHSQPSRGRRILEHCVHVSRHLCVMRESGQIDPAPRWVSERGQRLPVQLEASVGRERLLDGESGELVTEHHTRRLCSEHARRQTLVEIGDAVTGQCLQKPKLGMLRDDRGRLEQRVSPAAETCGTGEHRVPDRRGNPLGPGSESLDDEKGIACRRAIELFRVDGVRLCELCDRRRRELHELHATNRAARRQLAEHPPQRVDTVELVVPIGREHERRDSFDPPDEQPQNVERGLVRPVQILEDEDARHPPQLTQERNRDLVRSCLARQ